MKFIPDRLRQKIHKTFGPKDPDEKSTPSTATSVTRTSFVILGISAVAAPVIATVANIVSPGISYVQQEFLPPQLNSKVPGYARALIQLAQREGSLNLLCTSKEAVKPLVETYSRMFSVPVTVSEATEEEIQEFIQQTYVAGKSVDSETSDIKLDVNWGFEKPDVIFLASEALMQCFEASAYCQSYEVSSTDQYVRAEFFDATGQWYAYAADPLVLLVNQERLNEKKIQRPREWTDLLIDGLRGRYVFPDPALTYVGKKFESLFLGQYGLDKGTQIIQSLFENVDAFSESTYQAIRDTGFGKYRACVCSLSDAYRAITKDDFDNLSVVLPGASYFSTIRSFICQGSKHTYSAYLWQEFITKRDSAEHMGEMDSFFSPVIEGTPNPWYASRLNLTGVSESMQIVPAPTDTEGNLIKLEDVHAVYSKLVKV